MTSKDYFDRLVRAEILAIEGYGRGYPIWLPNGLEIIRRINSHFIESASESLGIAVEVVEHRTLLPTEVYWDLFSEVWQYSNIYMWDDPSGHEWVIKPDAAQLNLDHLLSRSSDGAVATVHAAIRFERGKLPPLFRDRNIWPLMQLNVVCQPSRAPEVLAALTTALQETQHWACIPSLAIDLGSWKSYASRTIFVLAFLDSPVLTVTAMAFQLSSLFHQHFDTSFELFDCGYSEKILGMIATLHYDKFGLALPTTVAPTQVAVTTPEEPLSDLGTALLNEMDAQGVRWKFVKDIQPIRRDSARKLDRRVEAGIFERGISVLVQLQPSLLAQSRFLDQSVTIRDVGDLRALLQQHDDHLRERARRYQSTLDSSDSPYCWEYVCDLCRPQMPEVFGRSYPPREGLCRLCQRPGYKVLVSKGKIR